MRCRRRPPCSNLFNLLANIPFSYISETSESLLLSAIPARKLKGWRDACGGGALKKQKAIEAEDAAAKKAATEKVKEKKAAEEVGC